LIGRGPVGEKAGSPPRPRGQTIRQNIPAHDKLRQRGRGHIGEANVPTQRIGGDINAEIPPGVRSLIGDGAAAAIEIHHNKREGANSQSIAGARINAVQAPALNHDGVDTIGRIGDRKEIRIRVAYSRVNRIAALIAVIVETN